ncbi:hypothetical protein QOZ80_4AG0318130 [Eleusine coracana subsp. coracana]|nr:hypothetical protein QOZ80_4AG0318130 [Eleusine coracana subsp. coracana]
MLHCWTLLEHNEKWVRRNEDLHPLKKRPSSEEDIMHGAHGGFTPNLDVPKSKRPPGRKQEKERLKRGWDTFAYREVVQEMMTSKMEIEAEKKNDKEAKWMELKSIEEAKWMELKSIKEHKVAIREEKLKSMREKANAKKLKEENKIMFMDTTELDDTQRAYVLAMRAQILASKIGCSGSGSA